MGSWDDENGIVLSGLEVEGGGGWEGSLNRSLTVTTILNPPYMMIKVTTISIIEFLNIDIDSFGKLLLHLHFFRVQYSKKAAAWSTVKRI